MIMIFIGIGSSVLWVRMPDPTPASRVSSLRRAQKLRPAGKASPLELLAMSVSVLLVDDGVEALEVASGHAFDLVLTDQNMPRMDGLTLIQNLRRKVEFLSTPLLVLTTEADSAMKVQARAAGATGWIAKPFDPQRLLDVVVRMIGGG